jgi:cell division protein FtsL
MTQAAPTASAANTRPRKPIAELAAVIVLAAAVTASGVWVTGTKHRARQLFVELEELNREQDRLQIDWWRLQIEQSTWATHARIEALARERLQLTNPSDEQLVLVAEPENAR